MLLIKCDFCNATLYDERIIIEYKRSILEFFRLIPKLLCKRTEKYSSKWKVIGHFDLCADCQRRIKIYMFAVPNRVEELRDIIRETNEPIAIGSYEEQITRTMPSPGYAMPFGRDQGVAR